MTRRVADRSAAKGRESGASRAIARTGATARLAKQLLLLGGTRLRIGPAAKLGLGGLDRSKHREGFYAYP